MNYAAIMIDLGHVCVRAVIGDVFHYEYVGSYFSNCELILYAMFILIAYSGLGREVQLLEVLPWGIKFSTIV